MFAKITFFLKVISAPSIVVSRQLSEIKEFTFFYEAIVKWAVSVPLEFYLYIVTKI